MNLDRIFLLPNISKIQLSFSLIGILFYFSIIILFLFYYNCIILIKEEILSLIEIFIDNETFRSLFIYITQIIAFSLLLAYLNKCLTQKIIVEDIKDLEINDKIYILLIFMLCSFPFQSFLDLQIFERYVQYILKMVLAALLYYLIYKRMKLIIERLNEQKLESKNENNYLMGSKENYYVKMIKTINMMYLIGFILLIFFMGIKIYMLHIYTEYIEYFGKTVYYCGFSSIILAELLLFFCINKLELENGIRKGKINSSIKKFVIVKIFNQDDNDENVNF
mgnify:CR=1 FL=1